MNDTKASPIKMLRVSRGLTQGDLAGICGVSQARISQIERDPDSLSVDLAEILSDVFNCAKEDLYSGYKEAMAKEISFQIQSLNAKNMQKVLEYVHLLKGGKWNPDQQ